MLKKTLDLRTDKKVLNPNGLKPHSCGAFCDYDGPQCRGDITLGDRIYDSPTDVDEYTIIHRCENHAKDYKKPGA